MSNWKAQAQAASDKKVRSGELNDVIISKKSKEYTSYNSSRNSAEEVIAMLQDSIYYTYMEAGFPDGLDHWAEDPFNYNIKYEESGNQILEVIEINENIYRSYGYYNRSAYDVIGLWSNGWKAKNYVYDKITGARSRIYQKGLYSGDIVFDSIERVSKETGYELQYSLDNSWFTW